MERQQLLIKIADILLSIRTNHPLRVAIDGIDNAGKTTLANGLALIVRRNKRQVIRASIDGFHNPEKERYKKGVISPEGYFLDSFNYEALKKELLKPLGANGNKKYRTSVFNFRTDSAHLSSVYTASPDAILLFDGVFLLRKEIIKYWDYSIFIHIDFPIAMCRALIRDKTLFGRREKIREKYEKRYFPGQRLYLELVQPEKIAQVIIKNNDVNNPELIVNNDALIKEEYSNFSIPVVKQQV
ncbi:hypothetical protein FJY90_01915 [Candidatus Gottesmanbacteria bacterium]|nr:hypothetical protein [Candidatus Gottesmanbacteria bacterium]